jgi:peptidoglycan/LPS O-acetylase OafA/YrhL
VTNQKLPEIDILRILSILIVVLLIHIPLSYAYNFYLDLDQFGVFLVNNVGIYVSMGSFVFVSGFELYLNPNNRNFNSGKKLLTFLKKRLIRIFPLYWIAIILFLFFVGYLDIDPLYLLFHFLGMQIIVAPYFGPPMLTLWFIGIIVIYYLIYIVLNSLGSIKLIIPASFGILFFFVFLNGFFGLVESRFFIYYFMFIAGIVVAHIYTSPPYNRVKERLREIPRVILLLIPLCTAILGFITFQFLTQFCFSTLISEYGNYNLYFILETNPDFFQLATIYFLINLIIMAFLVFAISSLNFIFRAFRLIFSKSKIESVVSVIAYSTYCVYLFHRVFLAIFIALLSLGLNIDMREQDNFYIVLIFIPFIFLFSYLIQKALDWVWKLGSRHTPESNLKIV